MTKDDRKILPSKKVLKLKLDMNYIFSSISVLIYLVIVGILLAGIFIIYPNALLEILAIFSNVIVLIALITILIILNLKGVKKENFRYSDKVQIIFIIATSLALIVAILNCIFHFTNKTVLLIGVPFVFIILSSWLTEFKKVHEFVDLNYEDLSKQQIESYDLFEKSKLYIEPREDGSFLFLLARFGWFILCVAFTIFCAVAFNYIETIQFILPEFIMNWSFVILMIEFAVIITIFCVHEIHTLVVDKNADILPNFVWYFLLAFNIIFKFFVCQNSQLNDEIHSLNLVIACIIIFFLYCNKLREDKNSLSILKDVKSKFSKNELDLVMIDEPLDEIGLIGQRQYNQINKLHNILEKAATNVPLTISFKGEWGCGKSSIAKALSVRLSKINRYSFAPFNSNDSFKKRYFTINLDLMKFDSPLEVNDYIYSYISKLSKIYFSDKFRNIDCYFKKMLELLSDFSENYRVSLLSKLAMAQNRKKFKTIEELKTKFQSSIDNLLKKSKRAGIILIIDDIDRLPTDEHKKIRFLLKEFFNIHGLKIIILNGQQKNIETDERQEFELQKFINVEYVFESYQKNNNPIVDENFLKLMSIAAREVNKENNDLQKETEFFKFDNMLCEKSFVKIMQEVLAFHTTKADCVTCSLYQILDSIDSGIAKQNSRAKDKKNNQMREFIEFIEDLFNNPRTYKSLLRKCVLENKSIIQSLIESFDNGSKKFKQYFKNILSSYFEEKDNHANNTALSISETTI